MRKLLILLCIAWMAAPAGVAQAASETWGMAYYAVQQGDCLDAIAATYHISKEVIGQMNLLHDETIIPGQILRLPVPGQEDMMFGTLFLSPNHTDPCYTALHFNVSAYDLKRINFFPVDYAVLKGQIMKIPARYSVFPCTDPSVILEDAYIIQEGDKLSTVAAAFSLDEDDLMKLNHLDERELHPGYILHLGRMDDSSENGYRNGYVVQKGDTLSRIAGKFSLVLDEIVAINDLADVDQLVKGQILLLP